MKKLLAAVVGFVLSGSLALAQGSTGWKEDYILLGPNNQQTKASQVLVQQANTPEINRLGQWLNGIKKVWDRGGHLAISERDCCWKPFGRVAWRRDG
jgi:hypothetical protein